MNTRLLVLALFLTAPLLLPAQELDLETINSIRLQRQKHSMLVLGGWAVTNIAVGLAMFPGRSGSDRYFHIMNAGWNAVNLGIAALGYWSAAKADPGSFDLYQSLAEQRKMQVILMFNAGLDLAYMAGGAYLIERSGRGESPNERLKGFGQSLILQGAFLFAFDIVSFIAQANLNPKMQQLISGLSFDGQRLGFTMTF